MTAVTNEYENIMVPTYVINLKERTERLEHILAQFRGRDEFDVKIVEACKHDIGAVGLWKSIVKIVKMAIADDDDVIIICEDDHEFTASYSKAYLLQNIIEANEQGASILSGGIGGFSQAVPLTENRMWVNPFLSAQFIVLFKNIFDEILNYQFKDDEASDMVLAALTSHKMVLYPFISKQKYFGYSDVTALHNDVPGIVDHMFEKTIVRLQSIQDAYLKYLKK